MGKLYSIRSTQQLPTGIEQAWEFFSNPGNLQLITPQYMNFKIISQLHTNGIYAGQLITYKVKPVLGIPMKWVTIISQVKEHEYFIDVQQSGPYSFWHHEHRFVANDGGTELIDIVHYKLPLGWLGRLANNLFVQRQLQDIFSYRRQRVEEIFPADIVNK